MKTAVCVAKKPKGNGVVGGWATIIRSALGGLVLAFLFASPSAAYTTVIVSTATTESTEQALLNQISQQFNASLFVNPLATNVYQVKLFGLNPNYNPSKVTIDTTTWFNNISAMQSLEAFISTDSYVNGWANGMEYDRASNMHLANNIMTFCSSSNTFIVDGSTWNTVAVDSPTCRSVLNFMWQQLYQLNFASPTVMNAFDIPFDYAGNGPPPVPTCGVTLSSSCIIQPSASNTVDCYYVTVTPNGTPTATYRKCPGH